MIKLVLRGGKNVVDDNTIHRGARMVFLILNFNTQLGRSQIVDNDHDTFVERFRWRCNQSAATSSQRNDEADGYWNHG